MSLKTASSVNIDNTDWLKTAAILLVVIDHTGYFFIKNNDWWSVFGRFAAPIFFFLLGYARSRVVPVSWVLLGILLTVLDSWNNEWAWVAPNILLSLSSIRWVRPHVETGLQRTGLLGFVLLVIILILILPIAGVAVEYGSEGWLWALFGLIQRNCMDARSMHTMSENEQGFMSSRISRWENIEWIRIVAVIVAAIVAIWQEQTEYSFAPVQLSFLIAGMALLSIILSLFHRGTSRFQAPERLAVVLRLFGHHTLEIYAIQIALSEVIVNLFPGLAA
jgi:hypothetical protein